MNAHSFDTDPMPAIKTPQHQRALKGALMQAHPASQGNFIPFSSKFMSFFKYIAPMGATVTLAVLLAQSQGTDLPTFSNPLVIEQVSAQELISDVTTQIQGLSLAEMEALQERLGVSDLAHILEDAQMASDLRDLSLDAQNVVASDGKTYCYTLLENSDETMAFAADIATCSVLLNRYRPVTYTAPDGTTVVMAVDSDLYPAVVMSVNSNAGESSVTFGGGRGENSVGLNFGMVGFEPALPLEANIQRLVDMLPSMFNPDLMDQGGEDMEATAVEMTVDEDGLPQVQVEGGEGMGGDIEYGVVEE